MKKSGSSALLSWCAAPKRRDPTFWGVSVDTVLGSHSLSGAASRLRCTPAACYWLSVRARGSRQIDKGSRGPKEGTFL